MAGLAGGRGLPFVLGAAAWPTSWTWSGTLDPPAAPVAPGLVPLDAGALGVLAAVVIVVVGAWLGLRRAAAAADPDLASRPHPARRWCCVWP